MQRFQHKKHKFVFFLVHVNDPFLGFLLGWLRLSQRLSSSLFFFLPLCCFWCKFWNFMHGCEIWMILWIMGQSDFDLILTLVFVYLAVEIWNFDSWVLTLVSWMVRVFMNGRKVGLYDLVDLLNFASSAGK
jgi:hypothetical protein